MKSEVPFLFLKIVFEFLFHFLKTSKAFYYVCLGQLVCFVSTLIFSVEHDQKLTENKCMFWNTESINMEEVLCDLQFFLRKESGSTLLDILLLLYNCTNKCLLP